MKSPDKFIVVLMTCATEEEGRKIADALLDERKAACVGIFPKGESFFWWEGKKDRAEEYLLIAKTRKSFLDELIRLVKEVHSYEVPEIIALPIVAGNPDYLDWLKEELPE